jgi:hypothetical protein
MPRVLEGRMDPTTLSSAARSSCRHGLKAPMLEPVSQTPTVAEAAD